jgi:hypothetical protein
MTVPEWAARPRLLNAAKSADREQHREALKDYLAAGQRLREA